MQTDHLGNHFKSVSAMVRHYGISRPTYISRVNAGWTVEEALTVPILKEGGNYKPNNSLVGIEDHLGNKFNNKVQMAKHWGISSAQLYNRLSSGMSLAEALTKPTTARGKYKKREVADHKGNSYRSVAQMARSYGIASITLHERLKRGWSVEEALTTPVDTSSYRKSKKITNVKVQDHLGNWYDSYYALAKAYDLSFSTLYGRVIKLGWSIEKALLTPTQSRTSKRKKGVI